jgi:TRAP-type C4-dicarboxylate transport system substrate-binding protein
MGRALAALLMTLAWASLARAADTRGDGSLPAYGKEARPSDAPIKLRLATIAPSGSGWARVMRSFSDEVAAETGGRVTVKWYLNGVAGDEGSMVSRILRGQIDGAGLSIGCEALAPSLRVVRIPGLIRDRAELAYVLGKLQPRIERELADRSMTALALVGFGPVMAFTRTPVRRFEELAHTRMWLWDRDDIWIKIMRASGMSVVPTPIDQAARTFEDKGVDGFYSVPGSALVFQWSTLARAYVDLPLGFLAACLVTSQAAIDGLPLSEQAALRTAAARFGQRFDAEGARLDASLLGGLFEKQGLKRVTADAAFRTRFFETARQGREREAASLVSQELLAKVLAWLADYRATANR